MTTNFASKGNTVVPMGTSMTTVSTSQAGWDDDGSSPSSKPKVSPHPHRLSQSKTAIEKMLLTADNTISDVQQAAKEEKRAGKLKMKITEHRYFTNSIGVLICVNAISLAIETDHGDPSGVLYAFENFVCAVFFIEMILKVYENRLHYFACGFNVFDFVLTWYSAADLWLLGQSGGNKLINLSYLRLLRVLRLVRVFKLLRNFKELWLILLGILNSLKVICWVSALLALVIFVVSIAVTEVVGHERNLYPAYNEDLSSTEIANEWNNYEYFGTIDKSMITLFNIGVLAEWSEIIRPLYAKQPYVLPLLFAYMALVFFGIMNSIIGVIVEGMMDAVKKHHDHQDKRVRQDKHTLLEALAEVIQDADQDNDGHLTEKEVHMIFKHPGIQELLTHIPDLDVKAGRSEDLLALFDCNGSGTVTYEEFLQGMYHLIENPGDWKFCELKIATNSLKQMVNRGFQKISGQKLPSSPSMSFPADGRADELSTPKRELFSGSQAGGEDAPKPSADLDDTVKWPAANGCLNGEAHGKHLENGLSGEPQATPQLQSTLEMMQESLSTLHVAVARLGAQQSRVEVNVSAMRDELADLKAKVRAKADKRQLGTAAENGYTPSPHNNGRNAPSNPGTLLT
eukprot:gnl/MRDRNA2_/MRDRNA2_152061_c0_seq1.p1 gnl/MRDRNA2_/MRDRNA2_152061_c0~~gnl/MRDRNA2_/MRDRNA2_152061_c0_seq1.p1  ORF type:complete len:626 (-),score=86.57 gnl/MRDRNA2_/MRDRNA2_152061_c0_seq1:98-1975(-)